MQKKGQVGLSDIPNSVMILGVAAVVGVIMLILVASVQDSSGQTVCEGRFDNLTTFNVTNAVCFDGSSNSATTTTQMVNSSTDSQSGIGAVYDQFSLIGLMIGLGAVLVILIAVFGFIALRQ